MVRKPDSSQKAFGGNGVRHFNVMHHMMPKASTIWSRETGIDRNPADQIEVKRPDDTRERYLSDDELRRISEALDERRLRKGTKDLNRTDSANEIGRVDRLTTGMRHAEIFELQWSDVMYRKRSLRCGQN